MKTKFVVVLFLIFSALPAMGHDANLIDGCVTEFDADVDYFPDHIEIVDAENFTVDYFNNYKVVTVSDAFDGASEFNYVLVQCGTPAPDADDFPEGTQFVEVPAGDVITMSTTQLPHLKELGLLDKLVGVESSLYVNTAEVVELFEAGDIVEVGSGAEVNVELVLDIDPSIVMTFGYNPDTDAHPILIEAGINTILNASWRENTPLARAEWIKYMSLFYNLEDQAEAIYDDISSQYNEASELAASIPTEERQTVLWNYFSPYSDSWTIPGAETYIGAMIADAGGDIALGDEAPENSNSLGFEVVYDRALDVDLWMIGAFGVSTLDDFLAQDSRYEDFAAFQNGNVWNNNRDQNSNGGNNYYELGVTNPHLILQDLVAMFYPELLPDHEFTFYQRLQ
jgi:iron complex transport system substrate-binding protein